MFGTRNARNLTSTARWMGALTASVIVGVLAALGTSPHADAATWYSCPAAPAVCGTTNAYLNVTCYTTLNFDGTKTWTVVALELGNGWDAPIAFQYNVSITGYKPWSVGWQSAQWGKQFTIYGLRVAANASAKTVSILEQFAYAPRGIWIYSPNGQYEYAVHNTSGPTVGSVGTGNSCTLR